MSLEYPSATCSVNEVQYQLLADSAPPMYLDSTGLPACKLALVTARLPGSTRRAPPTPTSSLAKPVVLLGPQICAAPLF